MKVALNIAVLFLALFLPSALWAETMAFDLANGEFALLISSPYDEGSYRLTAPSGFWGHQGTVYSYQSGVNIVLARIDNGAFDLISLDLLSGLFTASAPPETITGYLAGGGTVTHTVSGLGTQTFSGFTGLSSVE